MSQQEILKLILKPIEKGNVNVNIISRIFDEIIVKDKGEIPMLKELAEKPFAYSRCKCREEISITKKRKSNKKRAEKSFAYPSPEKDESMSKTFQIKYDKKLSSVAKFLLSNFRKKYLYYAIDDILYLFKSNSRERDNLLEILYTPVLFLQNNLSINFFDIWICEIYIEEVTKVNKFLTTNCQTFEPFSYITMKLLYKTKIPIKKQESLW